MANFIDTSGQRQLSEEQWRADFIESVGQPVVIIVALLATVMMLRRWETDGISKQG